MIDIIQPEQFKTVPWKNGKGETVEMAINSGGTLDSFDWRLSMASVVEDGVFSNFNGYTRNLILIDGDGINLQHNDSKIDRLSNLLDIATFDGGNKTVGNLHSNEITDLNVITRTSRYSTKVDCQKNCQNYALDNANICFIYSLFESATIKLTHSKDSITLPAQHLMKITELTNNAATITGKNLIIIYLNACADSNGEV